MRYEYVRELSIGTIIGLLSLALKAITKTGRVILLFEVGEIVEEITKLVGSSDEIGKTYINGTDSTRNRKFIKKRSQTQP
jgi:hypothetical protein